MVSGCLGRGIKVEGGLVVWAKCLGSGCRAENLGL